MFPHTVTVYNTYTVSDKETLKDTYANYITILRGVLLDATKGSNVKATGMTGADAVDLYIPFNVESIDGITGEPKEYIGPVDFWRNEDFRGGKWTLSDSGNTFFIKGEVVEPERDREFLEAAYDNVYEVTKIDEKDFGGLRHWEVGGK